MYLESIIPNPQLRMELKNGKRLLLTDSDFYRLKTLGLKLLAFALPVGQARDWSLSLKEGSRLHVHEFSNGKKQLHLDEHDPDKSWNSMLKHFLFDTGWLGPIAAVLLVYVFFFNLVRTSKN